ncbi:YutD family protein [Lactobacillus sp. PSON]|uniref:YutD family protein n=1 Tax=Lactobacillus sp. PSON TaxID=3455454 RepID=UPI004043404A
MTKKETKDKTALNSENKFEKEQPLRHPLTKVVIDEENQKIKIGNQIYKILINKFDAIDIDLLRKKYDPYLDQYDFLVGDISSEHLRLKGFYKDVVRTSIDKKQRAIADYLIEYCNPGSAYFVLQLIMPVHHYTNNTRKREHYRGHYKKHYNKKHVHNNFKKRKVRSTKFKKQKSIAVKKENSRHAFVIKKKRKSE